ncbi:MAG: LEA type 2 family protein [Proteobacteria bacterium]|jgi:LEA14-like dessication related protein|nr:LEA type 2 family protein [Pseudomonadota bacterium]MDA0992216.1 LEA type 2 family protein [Pseudomonadota bacterium]
MRHIRKLRTASAALIAFGVAACAGTGTLVNSPTVNLTSVELTGVSLRHQTFELGFDVDNPNPFPLPIKVVQYRVFLDDERFAGGETTGSFTVPAHGRDDFVISVDLDFLNTATQFVSLFSRGVPGNVNYELLGSLTVDIPFTKPIPFSSSGVIQVDRGLY